MKSLLKNLGDALVISSNFNQPETEQKKAYDPEMLYVECRHCGKPVMWEAGRTTSLLRRSNVNLKLLDEHCLIVSDGCKECMPESDGFGLSIVRLAGFNSQDLLMMKKPGGHA